jgi:hypothetical protein
MKNKIKKFILWLFKESTLKKIIMILIIAILISLLTNNFRINLGSDKEELDVNLRYQKTRGLLPSLP